MAFAARPTWDTDMPAPYVPVGAKGGGWGIQRPQATPEAASNKEKSMVDQIGEMTEGKGAAKDGEGTVLKERSGEEGPPNPKKRMYEQEKENGSRKDEL